MNRLFPAAERVAGLPYGRIAGLGMPGARARTVLALARAVADGDLELVPNADIDATLDKLRALPGVGEWTAQYIAMRALAWPDAFPHTDLGVMQRAGRKGSPSRARGRRSLAALARLRRHAPLERKREGITMLAYDEFKSPQGQMILTATPKGLAGVYFKGQKHFPEKRGWQRDARHPLLRRAKRELAEYFAGRRTHFSVALDPQGTPFQRSVWRRSRRCASARRSATASSRGARDIRAARARQARRPAATPSASSCPATASWARTAR